MDFNNTAPWDRMLRIALGALLMVIGWQADAGVWVVPLRVLALYPLVTGLAGWCPIYALLRFATKR